MHSSDNRGSWEFHHEDTLTEETGNFPSTLAQVNFSGQKKAGSAVDVPGLAYRNEDIMSESWRKHWRHVFVLSEAGKPIYSRYCNEEALSSTMGVMMALVSFVQAGGNMIQSIFSVNLKHFLYKPSKVLDHYRQLPQFTCVLYDAFILISLQEERIRLLDLYRNMHYRIHCTSRPLKLIYHSACKETLLAWVTSKFEMFACFAPLVTKKSAFSELTKLLRWIKKEEDRLFICQLPRYSTAPQPGRSSTDKPNTSDTGLLSLL
ncbi:vacuolar fusion protein MON1 homolog B-like [Carassius carassius]|uniref:vacuolar fusion protein MON1 homolog B-like n=1 Tax=Carassius carassius TaxID=217509 RepID=UPI0028696D7B|nr:vacuolar fusion protein MON1 homolog B-like [Carassius carassius]